jgi:Sec-independent protein secretion pathway component TatC
MWIPMAGLYELGILLVRWTVPKSEFSEEEVPYQPEETASTAGGDEPRLD